MLSKILSLVEVPYYHILNQYRVLPKYVLPKSLPYEVSSLHPTHEHEKLVKGFTRELQTALNKDAIV